MYNLIICKDRRVGTKLIYNEVPIHLLQQSSTANSTYIYVPGTELTGRPHSWKVAVNQKDISGGALDRIVIVNREEIDPKLLQFAKDCMCLSDYKIVVDISLDS